MKSIGKVLDIIVFAVCLAIYVLLFIFLLTDIGAEWFKEICSWFPLMDLVEGTLSDINKFIGAVFGWFRLDKSPLDILVETYTNAYPPPTPLSFLWDFSKLLLSSMIQSTLFLIFSFLFLHAGDMTPNWLQYMGSFWYVVNNFLLKGISLLVGGVCGSGLIVWVEYLLRGYQETMRFWFALTIFLVMFVLFSIYFTLKTKYVDRRNSMLGIAADSIAKHTFSFGRSLIKTLLCNILPELITRYITNIVIVGVFFIFTEWEVHIFSFAALCIFLGWCQVEDMITTFLVYVTEKLPLPQVAKYCPLSGLLWLPATVSMMAFLSIGSASTFSQPGASWVEQAMLHIPFAVEWWNGTSAWDLLRSDFTGQFGNLVHLFLLCTLMALLQYVSSSYTVTLWTQIVGRLTIIMGLMMVIFALFNLFGTLLAEYVISQIIYTYMAGLLAASVIAILFMLQPYLMLQGLATTVLLIALMHWVSPGAMGSVTWDAVTQQLWWEVGLMAINVIFSLLQNIASVAEKRIRKAASAATGGILG